MRRTSQKTGPEAHRLPTLEIVTFRPATIDDLAEVKVLHTSSFRALAGAHLAEEQLDAFTKLIGGPAYTETLMATNLLTAWVDSMLVGTAGWSPGNDRGATARISDVFIHPLFKSLGIASDLLKRQESAAAAAGFTCFSASAPWATETFFLRAGYQRTSQGVRALTNGVDMPVTFLRKSLSDLAN